MDLPIDFRNRPFRKKYIDEETPVLNRWFVFGQYEDSGVFTVGISDGNADIFTHIPFEVANRIVEARDHFLDQIFVALATT